MADPTVSDSPLLPERPTGGVNVVFIGTGGAVRRTRDQQATASSDTDAYQSGNQARIKERLA